MPSDHLSRQHLATFLVQRCMRKEGRKEDEVLRGRERKNELGNCLELFVATTAASIAASRALEAKDVGNRVERG